ncbi:Sec14p-like phosphatidylinositol transfer family protein [Actinidia rufa]|uniref:Sec14p-like phosphatidylinositol transfer family protein n=1 Tax=Actinidia rufa TaxID=165716 RepID=A0A7J0G4T0_9ERIC|nr:Sec14p-like phosphatidylinositol transfer family protein [Actinidia rufa]
MAQVTVSNEQEEVSKDVKDNAVAKEDLIVEEQSGEIKKDDGPQTGEIVEEKKMDGEEREASLSTTVIVRSGTFKEESNLLSDLKEYEKAALNEMRLLLEDAIIANTLLFNDPEKPKTSEKQVEKSDKSSENGEKQSQEGKEKGNSSVKEGKEEIPLNQTEEMGQKKNESTEKEGKEEEKPKNQIESEKVEKHDGEEKGKISECNEKENNHVIVEESSGEIDKDISLWGVPLLPSKGETGTDVILLKFLRAREFLVNEAFEMLRNTLQWRKELKIDSILDEDFGADLNSAAYMSGVDREGHPVCYNVYGVFGNDEIYNRMFGTEERCEKFLRWRSQLVERGIQKLNFKPDGVSSLVQISDLKNTPGPARKELRLATKQAVGLLQDNYPELVARNIFINVPFWYYAFNALLSPFLTQRTRSKLVFARPAKVTETLLKYIAAEEIPVQYGGFRRENDSEFYNEYEVQEVTVKAGSIGTVEIPAPEVGNKMIWDLTVLGWEVNYGEEFVPEDKGSYTLIVQKGRKMGWQEGSIHNSFTNKEPGKVVLTIDNTGSFTKKRVLYRYKTKNI